MAYCKQDMPPVGGYKSVVYQKTPIKNMSPYLKFGIFLGVTAYGWYNYKKSQKQLIIDDIQKLCQKIALLPLLQAEQDRLQLKYMKMLRDEEEKIMKNIPDWQVGKWKGFPVYLTIDPNKYYPPNLLEVYRMTDGKDLHDVAMSHLINW